MDYEDGLEYIEPVYHLDKISWQSLLIQAKRYILDNQSKGYLSYEVIKLQMMMKLFELGDLSEVLFDEIAKTIGITKATQEV